MRAGGTDRRLGASLLCRPLRVPVYSLAWCHDSLHFVLNFHASVLKMVDLKETIAEAIRHLVAFLQGTGS
jgi:hypothetical protein